MYFSLKIFCVTFIPMNHVFQVLLTRLWDCYLENLWQMHMWIHPEYTPMMNDMWWPPRPIQLRTSEVRIGDGDNVHNVSDFCSADSASDLSRLQSCELGSCKNCLSFKLEAGEKRGRREGRREAERAKPEGWLKGELCSGWLTHKQTDLLEV